VDSYIILLLMVIDISIRSHSVSPVATAAMRRAKRARQTTSSTFARTKGEFSNRGKRFFIAKDRSTYNSLV